MKLVYIASPLRGDIEGNIQKAIEYSKFAAEKDVIPLAPHMIFTRYLNDRDPAQRAQGLAMGRELLKRCDELWVFGHEISEGMKAEIDLADAFNIPVIRYADMQSEPVRSHRYSLKIEQDDDAQNPRDWNNLGQMICWHRRNNLGDKHDFKDPEEFLYSLVSEKNGGDEEKADAVYERIDGETPENLYNAARDRYVHKAVLSYLSDSYVLLPVYLYDHSGLSVSTGSFAGLAQHAEWDSGQVGYIYAGHDKIRSELGGADEQIVQRAADILKGEIKEFDCWLRGECYGFQIFDYEEEIDSCWGFIGNYSDAKAAMKDSVSTDLKYLFDEELSEEWEHD